MVTAVSPGVVNGEAVGEAKHVADGKAEGARRSIFGHGTRVDGGHHGDADVLEGDRPARVHGDGLVFLHALLLEPAPDFKLRNNLEGRIVQEHWQGVLEMILVGMRHQQAVVGAGRDDLRAEFFGKRRVVGDKRIDEEFLPGRPDQIKGGVTQPSNADAVREKLLAHCDYARISLIAAMTRSSFGRTACSSLLL